MVDIEILSARKEDYPFMAEIYIESFSGQDYNEIWTEKSALEKLNILSGYCDMFIAKFENKIVGFMALNPTKWYPGKTVESEEFAIKKDFRE